MLLDDASKSLDHNFILWNFDMTKLDLRALEKLDRADKEDVEDEEEEDEGEEALFDKAAVDKAVGSACCSIF